LCALRDDVRPGSPDKRRPGSARLGRPTPYYATAKAGVEGLTRAIAVDYGPHGIRANAVALGSITTPRYEALLQRVGDDDARRVQSQMRRLHPLGRVGTPAEVASVIAALLSDDFGFMSGAVIPLDGGRAAQGLDPEEIG
jgi:NAD(P)-dependent dehydrogenase (short-subunit alcohol dehydrogenase family)